MRKILVVEKPKNCIKYWFPFYFFMYKNNNDVLPLLNQILQLSNAIYPTKDFNENHEIALFGINFFFNNKKSKSWCLAENMVCRVSFFVFVN